MKEPDKPGDTLAFFLEEYEITQDELAKAIFVSRRRINEIVNDRREITPDTAIRLGKFFSTSPELWLELQIKYSLWKVKQNNLYHNIKSYRSRGKNGQKKRD